jgi:hypothetical protein
MTKPVALTDEQLKTLTDAEMQDATGYCGTGGRLSMARSKNEAYFLGMAIGDLAPPEIDGRSSVVDTTVRNTVLGMEAPLIKTFCGTDNVVEFAATTEDDEDKAKQATDYLNYLLRKKNPGYTIISSWIRDSLLKKVGFIQVWWDDSDIESTEEYRGQTDVQLALLLDDDEITPTEQRSYPDPEAEKQKAKAIEQMEAQLQQMHAQASAQPDHIAAIQGLTQVAQAQQQYEAFKAQPVPMLYDITVKRVKSGGKLCIENIPPHEMLISTRCKDIDDKTFKGRRIKRTISALRASGYLNVDDLPSDDSLDTTSEAAQSNWLNELNGINRPSGAEVDPGNREVWITECYVHADVNGNGLASWYKIVRAGDRMLTRKGEDAAVEVDDHPFVALPSIPMPHMLFGLCPADLALEHQRLKTSLKRSVLDNIYLQVNGRNTVIDGQVNLDDMLNNVPGGVVRIKQAGAVARLEQGMGDMAGAMSMMEATELDAEESTGWTRQSQGGNGMQLDQTATQVNVVTNRADSRVEIISRTMAETGFTTLFKKMLRLVTQYQNKADTVKLGREWANIDPREWTNQFDLTINVGLGTGNKDQLVQHLMALHQQQLAGLQIGTVTPKNVFNAQSKLAEALGFKNADQFFHDPDAPPDPNAPPKPPPPPDPNIVKAQLDQQKHSAELQFKQQNAEADRQHGGQVESMKAQMQMQVDRNRQEAEAQQHALKIQYEADLEQMKETNRHAQESARIELERWKAQLASDTAIYIAELTNKVKLDTAHLAADRADALAEQKQDDAQEAGNGND